jgi:hypothetical protein
VAGAIFCAVVNVLAKYVVYSDDASTYQSITRQILKEILLTRLLLR